MPAQLFFKQFTSLFDVVILTVFFIIFQCIYKQQKSDIFRWR
ncbi:hypothetical protein [Polaromonas sp. CG9_12]|nr:hypothetical protein [Polaromonas sp. CG9_12]